MEQDNDSWPDSELESKEIKANFSENEENLTFSICPGVTKIQMDLLIFFSFLLEGVCQMVISTLGVLGNLASIFLLTRPELRSCFNQLLAVLASFDLLYLITMLLESLRKLGIETDAHILLFPHIL